MPPSEPPTTANSVPMPRWSSSMACARTMSRTVMTGKSRPQGLPVLGLMEAGPAPHAAADHVHADDEVALGIDRAARPDHRLPPAGLLGDRMDVGDVLVASKRMADQHR